MTANAWKLPGYVVQAQLGSGGSGQVWRAYERSTGDTVAVKLLPAVERDELAAVRSEAAMLSGLDHPHLLHLHEVVPCDGALALVVDLAAGGSLASLLESRGRLTPGEVVTAIAPIGAALAYAHNAGVVHGDVSASNVLFTEIGFPLLADLGVARLAGDDAPVSSTPAYVDPAVAAGGFPAPASDVFMLGAVALHALTGQPPWCGASAEIALAAAAAGDIGDVPARLDASGVPREVADVVRRALELDASRRPTAAEFALDLRHAAEPVAVELGAGRPAAAGGTEPATGGATFTHLVRSPQHRPEPTGLRARLGRSPRLVAAATAASIIALAAAAALVAQSWRPHGPSHPQHAARPSPAAASPTGHPAAPVPPPTATAPTSTPAGSRPPASGLNPAAAGQVLATLDATRSRAFARRDSSLLSAVYVAGSLRTQDAATIAELVPSGCGLFGVHTAYTDVSVTARAPTRTVLNVRAALSPSSLECAGRTTGQSPGTAPTTLRVVLVRSGGGYLIESISR